MTMQVCRRAGTTSKSLHSSGSVSNPLSWNVIDPTSAASGLGVSHTVEINGIWGPEYVTGTPPASYFTFNRPVEAQIQAYWASFIRSYDPNTFRAVSAPVWKHFTRYGKERLLFETNSTRMESVPADQRKRCQYMSGIGASLQQ